MVRAHPIVLATGRAVIAALVAFSIVGCDKEKNDAVDGDDRITVACKNLEKLLAREGEVSGSAPEMAECKAELEGMAEDCGDEIITCVADADTEDAAMGCLLSCAFKTSSGGGEGGDGAAPRLPDRPPPSDR